MNKDNIVKIFKTKVNLTILLSFILGTIFICIMLIISNSIRYKKGIFFPEYQCYFFVVLNSFLRIPPIEKNEKELYLSSGCKRSEISFVIFVFKFISSLILWISYIIATLLFLNIFKDLTIEYFSLNFRNFSILLSISFLLSTISFYTILSAEINIKWLLRLSIEILFIISILVFMFFIVDNIPSFEIKLNVLISIAVYFLSIIISYIIGKEFMNKKDFV